MPHKCIQVSEEGFLSSSYTKTGKVLYAAAAVFVAAPPLERASLAQGLFLVGPGAGPERTRARHGQKYLRPRRHSTH